MSKTLNIKLQAAKEKLLTKKDFLYSLLVQILNSGTNFAFTLYALKVMGPVQFGIYGIALASALLILSIANASMFVRMTIHCSDLQSDAQNNYLSRMMHIAGLSSTILAALISPLVFFNLGENSQWRAVTTTSIAFTLMCSTLVLRDYFIRRYHLESKEKQAAIMCATIAAATLTLTALSVQQNSSLTITSALFILSVGQAAGVCLAILKCEPIKSRQHFNTYISDVKKLWPDGKWAIPSSLVSWFHYQSYIYVSAIFIGPLAVAYANAARIFIAPYQSYLASISRVLLPKLVRAKGGKEKLKIASKYIKTSTISMLAYGAACIAVYQVYPTLYEQYADGFHLTLLCWLLVLLAQCSREPAMVAAQSTGDFKAIFKKFAIATTISTVAAISTVQIIGFRGPILAIGLGEIALAVMLWKTLKKNRSS